MSLPELCWLAASYHMPSVYACRTPMSSATSSSALPAPGPGTVRLALMRTSIELFGHERTEREVFPIIRDMEVMIEPPMCVSLSLQTIRVYKASETGIKYEESIANREYTHADTPMVIYVRIPTLYKPDITIILEQIGWWGQADSFAQCLQITEQEPDSAQCVRPLAAIAPHESLRSTYTSLLTDFQHNQVTWQDVLSGTPATRHFALYLWPLKRIEHLPGSGRVLRRSISKTTGDNPKNM